MKTVKHLKRRIAASFSFLLISAAVLNMTACSNSALQIKAADLMEGIASENINGKTADAQFINSTANFSIELFKKSITERENSLISPLSVLLALAMTANGAYKETLTQLEKVLGKDIMLDELNKYLYSYISSLPSEKKARISIANSIWFRDNEDRLSVEKDFLQKNADHYNADIYKSAFNDQTLIDINVWVKANTDGMIDKILDQIDEDAVMYLINAIVFDAEWETVYSKNNISNGEFTAIDGSRQNADYMNSEENIYIDDGMAAGFIKTYAGGKYSFLALLPNEGVVIEDYIGSLSGESFLNIVQSAQNTPVAASLPKFSYDYKVSMNDALKLLGMPDAFSAELADFSKLGKSSRGNIYIGEALHKTFINVDELGTKAGAVTKVEMKDESYTETKVVKLDKPFIYAIIDNSTDLPVFIGTVMHLPEQ